MFTSPPKEGTFMSEVREPIDTADAVDVRELIDAELDVVCGGIDLSASITKAVDEAINPTGGYGAGPPGHPK
jgi:hypothetical protein